MLTGSPASDPTRSRHRGSPTPAAIERTGPIAEPRTTTYIFRKTISVPFSDGYDQHQRAQVNRLFGTTPVERWPHAEAIYAAAGMNATFRLYPGIGHTISSRMFDDVADFFTGHLRPSRTVSVRKAGSRVTP